MPAQRSASRVVHRGPSTFSLFFFVAAVAFFFKDKVSLTGLKLAQQAMLTSQGAPGAAPPRTGITLCTPSTSLFTFLNTEELKYHLPTELSLQPEKGLAFTNTVSTSEGRSRQTVTVTDEHTWLLHVCLYVQGQ